MVAQREPYEFPAVRAFAAEMQAWRGVMTKAELAETLGYTPQLIGQIEAGKNIPSKKFGEDLDTYFETNGLFVRLWTVITESRHVAALPPGFPKFLELERVANAMRVFSLVLISGLLQTEEYAREILLTIQRPDEVDQFLASRMERQAILHRDTPPRLWFTFDERALRSMIGGPTVMRGQLEYLLEVSNRPNTMVQVVSQETRAHAGLGGDLVLLSFENQPDVAYTESADRGQLVEDATGVADMQVRYDLIRGHALPVAESRKLIESILESL
jgi:DNA-binding XRE family transcriptional regulator